MRLRLSLIAILAVILVSLGGEVLAVEPACAGERSEPFCAVEVTVKGRQYWHVYWDDGTGVLYPKNSKRGKQFGSAVSRLRKAKNEWLEAHAERGLEPP